MPIEHARLHWDEKGQPLSSAFDDVYFSRESGLEETRYVFLQHNRLAERFAAMDDHNCMVVGETGLGTGLNFLCTWQLFLQTAPSTARLHFISVEKFPLQPDDLRQALALWPELEALSQEFVASYKVIQPGMQTMVLADGRVQLTLLVGDACEQLAGLDAQVNAWFLDGFAPAKNPQMWTQELLDLLARLSAPAATLATFTSAGFVRRGLIQAGFDMQRTPGFGRKREMLCGQLTDILSAPEQAPWFARPSHTAQPERHAIVIGAGLAGCSTAHSLSRRGWHVTLLEAEEQIASQASGNAQGMLYLKLSAAHTPLSQLVLAGFGYSRRLLEQWPDANGWQACGLLQLGWNEQEQQRQQRLASAFSADLLQVMDEVQASTLADIELPNGGLWYPDSGWVAPAAWCHWLINRPSITLHTGAKIIGLQHSNNQWHANSADGRSWQAPVVVVANAGAAVQLEQTSHLPLKNIRGQTSLLPATASSSALRCVVSADGYISPAHNGEHCVGASFIFDTADTELNTTEQSENIQRVQELSPVLFRAMGGDALWQVPLRGHAAMRCTTPDYLPLIGPVADASAFHSSYACLRKDARTTVDNPCPWQPGLYVNLAHGSRGLITAPLAGELLASWMCHEPLPLPRSVTTACHPNRFLLRQLIRNQ